MAETPRDAWTSFERDISAQLSRLAAAVEPSRTLSVTRARRKGARAVGVGLAAALAVSTFVTVWIVVAPNGSQANIVSQDVTSSTPAPATGMCSSDDLEVRELGQEQYVSAGPTQVSRKLVHLTNAGESSCTLTVENASLKVSGVINLQALDAAAQLTLGATKLEMQLLQPGDRAVMGLGFIHGEGEACQDRDVVVPVLDGQIEFSVGGMCGNTIQIVALTQSPLTDLESARPSTP